MDPIQIKYTKKLPFGRFVVSAISSFTMIQVCFYQAHTANFLWCIFPWFLGNLSIFALSESELSFKKPSKIEHTNSANNLVDTDEFWCWRIQLLVGSMQSWQRWSLPLCSGGVQLKLRDYFSSFYRTLHLIQKKVFFRLAGDLPASQLCEPDQRGSRQLNFLALSKAIDNLKAMQSVV